jgi:hypothetical protein
MGSTPPGLFCAQAFLFTRTSSCNFYDSQPSAGIISDARDAQAACTTQLSCTLQLTSPILGEKAA